MKKFKILVKNSNFLQNFLNPYKKFKRNPKKIKEKFKDFKNFQKFFENSFFHLLAGGGGALYY